MTDAARELIDYLVALHRKRLLGKSETKASNIRRGALRPAQRPSILAKTAGRCHLCGGLIVGPEWEADHVLAHSGGGVHEIDNYLPAHALCNNYRWDYLPEEFQMILKLGVWVRRLIEEEKPLGRECAVAFASREHRRIKRRKPRAQAKEVLLVPSQESSPDSP